MIDSAVPLRLRFAPSPTGYLHVGGARTALYNWCLARRHGGSFTLRIEDTDRERSSEEMVAGILDGMRWLGLDWDEGPHFQAGRSALHAALATRLLEAGAAYRCYCPPAELEVLRLGAERAGERYQYPGTCRDLAPEEVARREGEGRERCVRFRVPREGVVAWEDLAHGRCEFRAVEIEDFVLLRSDGTPTYQLAVVADDLDMRISHVVRGDDHISNTPKQILMYRAVGLEPPRFGHLPLILGPDKKKLSKRTGTTSVTQYRDLGYLPEALFNFLALLGWSPGDGREVMARDEIVAAFDFRGVNNASAVFDLAKLDWLNAQHLQRLDAATLLAMIEPELAARGLWPAGLGGSSRPWLLALLELLKPRSRKLSDLVEGTVPFLTLDFPYDPEAAAKHLRGERLADQVGALRDGLAKLDAFDPGATEAALRATAEGLGIKAGALIHATRVALTGKGVSPGIFELLAAMGKERTLARLERLRRHLEGQAGTALPAGA